MIAGIARESLRKVARRPLFPTAAAVTIACGVAAFLASASLLETGLRAAVPFVDSEQLLWITNTIEGSDVGVSRPSLLQYAHEAGLQSAGGYSKRYAMVQFGSMGSERAVAIVTQGFFETLRARPLVGRNFGPDDDRSGAAPVALVSYAFWRSALGGVSSVVGGRLRINNIFYTVVGVTQPDFNFPEDVVAWIPASVALAPVANMTGARVFWGIARMKEHVSLSTIRRQLAAVHASADWGSGRQEPYAIEFGDRLTRHLRPRLQLLMGTATAVLLLSTICVGTLLSNVILRRRREFALRTALGAPFTALIAELTAELGPALVLGSASGVVGAQALVGVASRVSSGTLPELVGAAVGIKAFWVTSALLVGLTAGLIAGGMLQIASARDVLSHSQLANAPRPAVTRFRRLLAGAGLGLAFAVLVTALVLGRSFLTRNIEALDPDNVYVARLSRPITLMTPIERAPTLQFMESFLDLVARRLPEGRVAIATDPPLTQPKLRSTVKARRERGPSTIELGVVGVTTEYFRALRIATGIGRTFDNRDAAEDFAVSGVLDLRAAHAVFGETSPVDSIFRLEDLGLNVRVIGTVSAVELPGAPHPMRPIVYVPYQRLALPWVTVVIRDSTSVPHLHRVLQEAALSLDRSQHMPHLEPLRERMLSAFEHSQFYAVLVGATAMLTVVVASFGLYSVVAFAVSSQVREIAIRTCLGAGRTQIVAVVLAEVCRIIGVAVFVGTPSAYFLANTLRANFFGVGRLDTSVLIVATAFIAMAGALAAIEPMRRALQVAPRIALGQ